MASQTKNLFRNFAQQLDQISAIEVDDGLITYEASDGLVRRVTFTQLLEWLQAEDALGQNFYTKEQVNELVALAEEIDGEVDTYAELPAAADHDGKVWRVDNESGTWGVDHKSSGFYKSEGGAWIVLSDYDQLKAHIQANEEAVVELSTLATYEEIEDGTEVELRAFSPKQVADAARLHGGGGGTIENNVNIVYPLNVFTGNPEVLEPLDPLAAITPIQELPDMDAILPLSTLTELTALEPLEPLQELQTL